MKEVCIKIYRWMILSITMQLVLLIVLDVYIFGNTGKVFSSAKYEDQPISLQDDIAIKVPSDALNVKVSYNYNFVAYISQGNLIIKDTMKKKDIKEIGTQSTQVTYYRWMNDRNTLIYAIQQDAGRTNEVQITTLNLDNNLERSLPMIKSLPVGSEINDVEFSHYTNVIYVKVLMPKAERIYSFDIMNTMGWVGEFSKGTFIREATLSDFLFVDELKGKIKIWNGARKTLTPLNLKEELVLLSMDEKDTVYLGVLDNQNKISYVKQAKMDEKGSLKEWSEIKLDTPIDSESLIITHEGKIYVNDIQKSTLSELGGKFNKQYDGKLTEIKSNSMITLERGKIIIHKLE